MTPDSHFEIPARTVARQVGDDMVILDMTGGRYLSLNPVGARIWELLAEGRSIRGICDGMVEEYDVPREVLEQDVLRLAGELVGEGLVEERQMGEGRAQQPGA